MANIEGGNGTAGLANVDANNDLMTSTPQVNTRYGGATGQPNYVGAVRAFSECDPGTLSGTPLLVSPYTTWDQNLQCGLSTPLFDYSFNGTAQDTGVWYFATTTMTAVQAGGFLVLNNSNIGTTGTGEYVQSKRLFNLTGNAGLKIGLIANISLAIAANQLWAFGLGIPASATTVPTDGVWFQYSSGGLIGVVCYNGTTTQTGALPIANPLTMPVNTNCQFQIRIHDRICYFMYNGNVIGSIATPAGQGVPFLSDALPMFVQQINTGTVTGGTFMQLKVAAAYADQLDSAIVKPYQFIQASKGYSAYQATQGATMGSTSNVTNSMAVGAGAALTNTTALVSALGGQCTYQPTLVAGLSGTDGILCSYTNPAGGVNQTPRTLYITGVRIQSIVSAAFTGGPVYALYYLAFGHTAVSLATPETASFTAPSTKAPRRLALGIETFPVTAAAGQTSQTNAPVLMTFVSPIVVNPGENIAIVVKNIGTVTSAGTITSQVTFDGYVE